MHDPDDMNAFIRLRPIPRPPAVNPGDVVVIRLPGRAEAVYIASAEPRTGVGRAWSLDLIPDPENEGECDMNGYADV